MSLLIPSSVQTMSSLEIAELTGKRHDNVKANILKLLEELNLRPPEFSGSLKNNQNQVVEVFNLPKRECDELDGDENFNYGNSVVKKLHNGTARTVYTLTIEQCMLVAMRAVNN